MEQGIALVDGSFAILFANRRFERFAAECLRADQPSYALSKHIRGMRGKRRAVIRLESKGGRQFFLVIKSFKVKKDRFYLIVLNKRRPRKMDLFNILQSEYDVTKEQFEIIGYLSKGLYNEEIAHQCNIKLCNVKYHLSHLYDIFYVSNRMELLNKIKEIENWVA